VSLGSAVKTKYCSACKFLDPNPKPSKPKCSSPNYKGDGACDDGNNNSVCEYDGGDYCAVSLGSAVKTNYCSACKCLDPNPKPPKTKCSSPNYKGDGTCDDGNNNSGCEYDGGDCCAVSLGSAVKTNYCSACKCLDPNPKPPECSSPNYKGDGVCDDGWQIPPWTPVVERNCLQLSPAVPFEWSPAPELRTLQATFPRAPLPLRHRLDDELHPASALA
jgi:hypothetical protein